MITFTMKRSIARLSARCAATSIALAGLGMGIAHAAPAGSIYEVAIPTPAGKVLPELKKALGQNHFKIFTKVDILKRVKAKVGALHIKDFNTPGFTDVTAVIFCSPVYFNKLLDADSKAASVCPLSVTVYSLKGRTMIAYPERGPMIDDTPAHDFGLQLDHSVLAALVGIPGAKVAD